MSLTHHIKPMKLFTAIASAAVIGASFLVPNSVEARNGWEHAFTSENAGSVYFKVTNRSNNLVTYLERSSKDKFEMIATANCSSWTYKYNTDSSWRPVMPGSNGDVMMKKLCR